MFTDKTASSLLYYIGQLADSTSAGYSAFCRGESLNQVILESIFALSSVFTCGVISVGVSQVITRYPRLMGLGSFLIIVALCIHIAS